MIDRSDWENVKKAAEETLRQHQIGVIINNMIIDLAQCQITDITKESEKNIK